MQYSPVVLAPTYNNARTVIDIVTRVAALDLPLIVINDGSTDATETLLRDWARARDWRGVQIVAHAKNRGKAAALHSGFVAAAAAGFTHALTMDTDGQLDPEQLPELLAVSRGCPEALVVGVRDDTRPDYPARSRLGRQISNTFVRLESGVRIQDSQCGLRVYPLDLIRFTRCRAGRFCFETEIVTRAGWAGCPIREVMVNCVYQPVGQRVSHFRPAIDTLRSIRMHVWLLARALCPWPHRRMHRPTTKTEKSWRQMWRWISPVDVWRQLREDGIGRTGLAAGLAVGVFIANLPLYGLQTLLSLYAARKLHLHPLSVLAGSQLSTPPLNVILIAGAVTTGHVLLHGQLPALSDYDLRHINLRWALLPFLIEWTIGALLLGTILAVAAFAIGHSAFGLIQARAREVKVKGE